MSAPAAPSPAPYEYVLTHIQASVCYHLRRFLLPADLNADPVIEPVADPAHPLLILAVLTLAGLTIWALYAARRDRAVSFALTALLVSPLIACAAMPLADVVAEHRVYIAGLGFSLLAAWFLTLRLRFTYAAAGILMIGMAYAIIQRNKVWADDLALWADTESRSPGLVRPHMSLGLAYQSAGRLDAALLEYAFALSLNTRLAPGYINRSAIHVAREELDAAEMDLKKAIDLSPNRPARYINLAAIALQRNRPDAALEFLSRIQEKDRSLLFYFTRGEAFFLSGR